ncbi:MAG: hypothetical protein Q8L74_05500 [Nitrospirota bacterium]|nr:hypothetical protein [Nitrospirota bacterium]MDP2382179.1 hypothetical protein [Nitrospirota bacterium]MDP3595519.1 hypothetical protein [Nitrospirota bacterium]
MLKITTHQETKSVTLIVEGRLAGPWVQELRDCWRTIAKERRRGAVVNFTGVTFVDHSGQALLRRLWQEGAQLQAAGCLNNCLVRQITASNPGKRSNGHQGRIP